ncbi:MAG: carboxypeptidase regulatory-like domain-containing protein, partial [Gemmatimonadetes bacterium]|nr:carboxypeptidase regulatory-like domain-containing protein [Gemmatimonadota bacterium]
MAQSTAGSSLSVRVTSQDGQPVGDASVRLLLETGVTVSGPGRTDRSGSLAFTDLIPGSYDLRIERVGFRPFLLQDVVIGPAPGSPLTVRLNPEAPPITRVDSATFAGGWSQRRSATRSVFLSQADRRRFPALHASPFQGVEGAGWTDQLGASQGLPVSMSHWELDGVPFVSARHPWAGASVLELSLPQVALAYLGVPESGLDLGLTGV